jgi:hypothetical protein
MSPCNPLMKVFVRNIDLLWTFKMPHNFMWGHAVAQLVEALRYKPEVRGFDSR